MSSNTPTTKISIGTNDELNFKNLTFAESTELLRLAIQKHPDLVPIVNAAIDQADQRALAKSQVDYKSMRSAFFRELHSMDKLRPSQQFTHAHRIYSTLQSFISEVGKSVMKISSREVMEEAFLCLQKFAGQLMHITEGEIEKILIGEDDSLMIDISEAMLRIATLLKTKGGVKDPELQEKIKNLEELDDEDHSETVFGKVYDTLWGDENAQESGIGSKRGYDLVNSDEDDSQNNAKKVER